MQRGQFVLTLANPFAAVVKTGALSQPTVQLQQLLLPFPQYTNFSVADVHLGVSTYHALQTKVEKRFKKGGTLLSSYTFSKLMANVSTLTTWLNGGLGATPGVNDHTEWPLPVAAVGVVMTNAVAPETAKAQYFCSSVGVDFGSRT